VDRASCEGSNGRSPELEEKLGLYASVVLILISELRGVGDIYGGAMGGTVRRLKYVEEVKGGGGQAAGVEGAWNVLSCTDL
jgi:hypothetical protein